MTRWQCRGVVVTQASVLAVVGLAFGVPVGIALARVLWRHVATTTPLDYHPPLAVWALALVVPLALVLANLLAAWPGHRAARLRVGQTLRTE
jgi:ABC-type lipoprotein release transport system permease subunit